MIERVDNVRVAPEIICQARDAAGRWRAEYRHPQAWVVTGDGRVVGWAIQCRPDCRHYAPGVLAVGPNDEVAEAVGGDARRGAAAWVGVAEEVPEELERPDDPEDIRELARGLARGLAINVVHVLIIAIKLAVGVCVMTLAGLWMLYLATRALQ